MKSECYTCGEYRELTNNFCSLCSPPEPKISIPEPIKTKILYGKLGKYLVRDFGDGIKLCFLIQDMKPEFYEDYNKATLKEEW